MAYDLSPHNALVAVFKLEGCPACEDYIPRLFARVQELQRQGASIEVYDPERKGGKKARVIVMVYDLSDAEPEVNRFADRFSISAMPTTVLLPRGPGAFKVEGSLSASQIDSILLRAVL